MTCSPLHIQINNLNASSPICVSSSVDTTWVKGLMPPQVAEGNLAVVELEWTEVVGNIKPMLISVIRKNSGLGAGG